MFTALHSSSSSGEFHGALHELVVTRRKSTKDSPARSALLRQKMATRVNQCTSLCAQKQMNTLRLKLKSLSLKSPTLMRSTTREKSIHSQTKRNVVRVENGDDRAQDFSIDRTPSIQGTTSRARVAPASSAHVSLCVRPSTTSSRYQMNSLPCFFRSLCEDNRT